jgi:hypothetical protein
MYVSKFEIYIPKFEIYISKFEMQKTTGRNYFFIRSYYFFCLGNKKEGHLPHTAAPLTWYKLKSYLVIMCTSETLFN